MKFVRVISLLLALLVACVHVKDLFLLSTFDFNGVSKAPYIWTQLFWVGGSLAFGIGAYVLTTREVV